MPSVSPFSIANDTPFTARTTPLRVWKNVRKSVTSSSGMFREPVKQGGAHPGQVREWVVRAVSLHPDPLPQGEGTARMAQWKDLWSGLYSAARRVQPLPK